MTFTVTQNDVLKQPENFFNFYYEALTQTSTNQVVSGRSGVENLFGEFESNNYGVDIFNPNLFPGIDSSYFGNINQNSLNNMGKILLIIHQTVLT